MEIKGTNVNLNQKVKEDSQIGKKLAKEMMIFADNNFGAVFEKGFQERLNKIEKLSTHDLINFIKGFDKEESIIELICDEVGSGKKTRKKACKKVLEALVNKAKSLGVDTSDFEKQFTTELDSQFGFLGNYVNTEKLDSIINALTQAIESRANFTEGDIATIQNTSVEEGQSQTNTILENRLENAYSAFGERVGEDGEMTTKDKDGNLYNGQMQRDGIFADSADFISKIWNNKLYGNEHGNTASLIREDLKATNEQLKQLQEAKAQGEEAYKAKFKEIFGIEYDYANIVAYNKAEQEYLAVAPQYELEMGFNREFKTLLSKAPLREEYEYVAADPELGTTMPVVTATKEQVYEREFKALAGLFEGGEALLNQALEEAGVKNASIDDKFEVLKRIAQGMSRDLHSKTMEATNGKNFTEVQTSYENSYKAAFGVENDIMKRITDYNISQEVGAGVLKAGVPIVASLASAASGIGVVGLAGIAAGTTVANEVVERGTSGKALNVLKEQGLGEYLEAVGKDVDWEATLKQAAISGGAVLIGGGVAEGVTAVMAGKSSVAQFAAMFGADVVTDAAWELMTTKQITWQGMVFTVLLSAIGNAVQLNQMKKAAEIKAGDVNSGVEIYRPDGEISTITFKKLKDFEGYALNDRIKFVNEAKKFSEEVLNMFPAELHAEVEEILSNRLMVGIQSNKTNKQFYIRIDDSLSSYRTIAGGPEAVMINLLERRGIKFSATEYGPNCSCIFGKGSKYHINGQSLPVPDRAIEGYGRGMEWIEELYAKHVLEPIGVKETKLKIGSIGQDEEKKWLLPSSVDHYSPTYIWKSSSNSSAPEPEPTLIDALIVLSMMDSSE